MKLLVFYPYLPWPLNRGTYQRTFHLLRELAREHEVDLFALSEGGEGLEHREVFAGFCRRVEVLPFQHPPWEKLFPKRLLNPLPPNVAHWRLPEIQAKLGEVLRGSRYDAVHAVDIVLGQYFLKEHRSLPLVLDRSRVDLQYQTAEHNRMNFSRKTKLLRLEGYTKLWLFERRMARRAAVEVVCGVDDKTFLHRYVSRAAPVEVLINGVDVDYFFPEAVSNPRSGEPAIIFCGAMDYNPNIDALRWYFSEMHEPLRALFPQLKVLVVGKDPITEIREYARRPGVTVTGGVPDVRPYYRQAWLQIVPLRIGGGSRLKIVESLAIGTPVVSTTIGAQGLGLRDRHDILLADDPEAFVQGTAELLKKSELRSSLERAGLESVRERLAWPVLGQQLNRMYANLFPKLAMKPRGEALRGAR